MKLFSWTVWMMLVFRSVCLYDMCYCGGYRLPSDILIFVIVLLNCIISPLFLKVLRMRSLLLHHVTSSAYWKNLAEPFWWVSPWIPICALSVSPWSMEHRRFVENKKKRRKDLEAWAKYKNTRQSFTPVHLCSNLIIVYNTVYKIIQI